VWRLVGGTAKLASTQGRADVADVRTAQTLGELERKVIVEFAPRTVARPGASRLAVTGTLEEAIVMDAARFEPVWTWGGLSA